MNPQYRPYSPGNPPNFILDMVTISSADVPGALHGSFPGGFVYVSFQSEGNSPMLWGS